MRLKLMTRGELTGEQATMYDEMDEVLGTKLKGFVGKREDGALVGPFAAMLQFPQFGKALWDYTKALIAHTTLPKPAHEVVILVTGAALHSRYELYAHERVAAGIGLGAEKIATIVAGQRPTDLSEEEAAAYDAAVVLVGGGQLPETTYQRALRAFGEQGVAELVYLAGGYSMVSLLLNAYDTSVPGREEGLPLG